MIYIFIFIFILTALLTNFILKFIIKNEKKKRRLIFLTYFIVLLSLVTLIYMQISNVQSYLSLYIDWQEHKNFEQVNLDCKLHKYIC